MVAIHADLTENKAVWSEDVIKGDPFVLALGNEAPVLQIQDLGAAIRRQVM